MNLSDIMDKVTESGVVRITVYVNGVGGAHGAMLRQMHQFLVDNGAEFECEVVDVSKDFERMLQAGILALPTIVRATPTPERRLIGIPPSRSMRELLQ